MNKPNQLTKQQVNTLKEKNNGAPIATETVTIDANGMYKKDFKMNENDVLLLNFIKQ
jgi:xylan 1,4-beta-xylosidase